LLLSSGLLELYRSWNL